MATKLGFKESRGDGDCETGSKELLHGCLVPTRRWRMGTVVRVSERDRKLRRIKGGILLLHGEAEGLRVGNCLRVSSCDHLLFVSHC